jgi:hypothetical protein
MREVLKRAFFIILLFLSIGGVKAAPPVQINAMTAAYLYNFILYIDWKKEKENEITICAVGNNTLGQSLYDLQGKQIKASTIEVKLLDNKDSFSGCELLFIPEELDVQHISSIVEAVKDLPVVTVSNSPDAEEANVMVSLFVQKQRLAFVINKNSADHAGIKFSSQLLRLAHRVID